MPASALSLVRADPALTPVDLAAARALHLEGHLDTRLPRDHALRPHLRGAALGQGTRHQIIARELRDLLRTWQAEAIPCLLTKGFALAEFEYPSPAARYYGDVDVVLSGDQAAVTRAVHLALARGWRTDGQSADPRLWTHETAHLFSPSGHTRIDLHRFIVSWTAGSQRRTREVTRQVWQRSRSQSWQGVTVRRPDALDQAVATLILARTRGGDTGGLKPADDTDLAQLKRNHGLTEAAPLRRARTLDGTHTVQEFLKVCNPWRQVFDFGEPQTRRILRLAPMRDGVLTPLDLWRTRLFVLPERLKLMPRVLTQVRAGLRHARTGDAAQTRTVRLEVNPPPTVALVAAGRWVMRLHRPGVPRDALHREYAFVTFHILRARSVEVFLVKGRDPQSGESHFWIEDLRGVPDWYGDARVARSHPEVQRWPARC